MAISEPATQPEAPLPRSFALRGALLLDTVGTLALNVSTTAINFALTFILARSLDASGYGAYAFAFAWANVLAVPAALGLGPLVVRDVAAYRARNEWSHLRGLAKRSNQLVLVSSIALAGIGAALGVALERGRPELLQPFLIGLALVPLLSLVSLRQSAMQGLGRVVLGRVPETVVAPAVFALLALLFALLMGLSATSAIALQVAATAGAFVLGTWFLIRSMPRQSATVPPTYETRRWLGSAVPFLAMGVVLAVNAQIGTILLGAIRGAYDTGVYGVAVRIGTFTSFLWLAATYPLMPAVARAHALADRESMERLLVRFGRIILFATAPLAVGLIVFATPIVNVFGGQFASAATPLRIIALGELLKVAAGFGGVALTMAGGERLAATAMIGGTACVLGIDLVAIPVWGASGAALGSAFGAVLTNLVMLWIARKRLGVRLAPLAPRGRG